ncbi:MAG: hypothetical protein LBB43_06880 [Spirochaetaceae bacterium]|jgi:hypothetical protein|nr:hypothetical protein [Spirochaetaceae bacterium]
MTQKIDLYSTLKYYANTTHSPTIEMRAFCEFIEKYAKHMVTTQPEWAHWTSDARIKLQKELPSLTETGKCKILSESQKGSLFLPYYYADIVLDSYEALAITANLPFPDESSLGITVPENDIVKIQLEGDFLSYLEKSSTDLYPIIKIAFLERYGTTLIVSSLLPERFFEIALLKIAHFLNDSASFLFVQNKLLVQLSGREMDLKNMLARIQNNPEECLADIENSGEFSTLFWTYFCALIKNDMKKKADLLSGDIAVTQAVYVLEQYNNFYKSKSLKRKGQEQAFKALDYNLEKPPYFFSLSDILKFTNEQGVLLLDIYSKDSLEEHLRAKTTEDTDGMAEFIVITGVDQWFVHHSRLIPLCNRFISETRSPIRKMIIKRWVRLLKSYNEEPSMKSDEEFEKMLLRCIKDMSQPFFALLTNKKFGLIYVQLEQVQTGVANTTKIFINGKLAPLSDLLFIKRADLLNEIKNSLPMYYSIPILYKIVAFLNSLKKKKPADKKERKDSEDKKSGNNDADIQTVLKNARASLIPEGKTLESYMVELLKRWNLVLDSTAQKNLTEDVNALVRDQMRIVFRVKHKVTMDSIEQMSKSIITKSKALSTKIRDQESLQLYIKLYIIKILQAGKV